jgi:competence protein ComEC
MQEIKNVLYKLCFLKKPKKIVVIVILLFVVQIAYFISIDKDFHLYFIDVDQGDSILIRTPDLKYILIDGGEHELIIDRLSTILPFWCRKIDVVIGTHADSDHIGGLVHVMDNYDVSALFVSDLYDESEILRKIIEISEKKNVYIDELLQDEHISIENFKLKVLWPERDFIAENKNQSSIVLKGIYKQFSFLLTGDIEDTQEHFLPYMEIGSQVLKISHHGSKTSTTSEFVKWVDPSIAVISCGVNNKFNHPHEETIQVLENSDIHIFRTDKLGTIHFTVKGNTTVLHSEF